MKWDKAMKKISVWLQNTVMWIYGLLMAAIVLTCAVGGNIPYYTGKDMQFRQVVYLAAGCVWILLLSLVARQCAKRKWFQKNDRKIMLVLSALMGMGLIVITYQYYFHTGWDASTVMIEAEKLAHSDYEHPENWYFSRQSNNIFIVFLFSLVMRAGNVLHFGNDYFYVIAFQCVGWAYTGYMVYLIVDKLCSEKSGAVLAWLIFAIVPGMSPWVIIPYTDTVGMLIVATIIVLLLYDKSHFLIASLLVMGYFMKPQIMIIGIAAVILYGCDLIRGWNRRTVINLLGIAAGMALALVVVYAGNKMTYIQVDEQRTFGIPHYLMMGLNERTNGVISDEDWEFSESFDTKSERDAANLQVVGERLKEMDAARWAAHLRKKILTVYRDGSFAWGVEGNFFKEMVSSGSPRARDFLRNIYLPEGKYYSAFLNVMQAVWLGILFFAIFAFPTLKGDKKASVLALAVIGFTLFELLFEPRARHSLTYIPIWIPFACMGIENIRRKLRWGKALPE